MATYQDFKNTLLPGNYALTKSMELTKVQDSGTLWYTKKFLVLYYYVFLSRKIMTREYIEKVIQHFDTYIRTLDESIRADAERYFYPEIPCQNFKSPEFKSFLSFANQTDFENETERVNYYNDAKKCYFALLMGSGGQTAVKEKIVEGIKNVDFTYSHDNIKNIIDSTIASVCAKIRFENKNYQDFQNGDVPRLLSERAINEICNIDSNSDDLEQKIREFIDIYPCGEEFQGKYKNRYFSKPKYSAVENDTFAPIRNERQILYYYGYFHSKSSGASEMEFSSLTPVGEAALVANSYEFLSIWEHQKIKMISQPANADIKDISPCSNSPELFSISYNPYLDVLDFLTRNNSLTLDEYKYIVSRKKHIFSDVEWVEMEYTLRQNLEDIKNFVSEFNRNGDIKNNDGRKELWKYILGIRNDLSVDNETNPHNLVHYTNKTVTVDNTDSLVLLYGIYTKLGDYKLQKYANLFERCEIDLRNRYVETSRGNGIPINARTKIDWDLYNIHLDKFILIGTIITVASSICEINDIANITEENVNMLVEFCGNHFSQLLRKINLRTQTAIKRDFSKFINAINDEDYGYFMQEEQDRTEVVAQYRMVNAEDLLQRIKEVSAQADVDTFEGRTRNTNLINLLKSYYIQCFLENRTLKCECCQEETFITEAGQPYVEYHHLIPFNKAYGPDHYLNLFALCPKCHRKIHFISPNEREVLYQALNQNNYLELTFLQRLLTLKEENLIRSYHLEYLLVDKAISEDEYNIVAVA